MSNRTLIEINHDFSGDIGRNPEAFLSALLSYLASASRDRVLELDGFGITVFGMRHHSDPYSIDWGSHKHEQKP